MTRTELEELALKLANNMQCFCMQKDMVGTHEWVEFNEWFEFNKAELSHFSYALLVEIQKKLEVVGYQVKCLDGLTVLTLSEVQLSGHTCTPLTLLPIIEE